MRGQRIILAAVVLAVLAALAAWLGRHRGASPRPDAGTAGSASPPTPASRPRDWPIFRGDPALRGVAGAVSDRLALRWTFETGKSVKSSAVIGGGRVYVGSDDGKVYSLDAQTSDEAWAFETGDAVEAAPLLHGGTIYVGSLDGKFYALEAVSGDLKWTYTAGGKIASGANVIENGGGAAAIVFGSYDNFVHAVDAATGEPRWRYETGNYVNATPAVAGGRVVVGGCDGHLHVISPADGTRLAAINLGAYIAAGAAVEGATAYVGHYGHEFFAVDLDARSVAWKHRGHEFPYFSSAALAGDRVLVGARDRRLHCLRRSDGHELWSFRTRGQVDSSPVICGERVVFGSADGRLYLVSLADGAEVWSYDLGEDIVASPAVAGGMIVIGSLDGKVYAFGPARDVP